MQTIQVGIEALSRASAEDPWKIAFNTPVANKMMTVSLGDAGLEVGPRFREVLQSIERNQVYPRTIKGMELELLGFSTRDSFTIKLFDNVPAYVEVSFRPFREFMMPTTPKVKGELTEWDMDAVDLLKEEEEEEAPSFFAQAIEGPDGYGGTLGKVTQEVTDTRYLVTGKVLKIKDGDTISFEIDQLGTFAANELQKGDVIDVRLAGLNTPETLEHGEAKGKEMNKEFVKEYGITDKEAFKIGDEARERLKAILDESGLVVVDLDAGVDGLLKTDLYSRYLGAIYKTDFKSADDVFDAGSFKTKVVNKMLLAEKSKVNAKAPLAMPYYYFIDNEFSRLGPSEWLYDVGIRKRTQERVGERIKREKGKEKKATNPITDGHIIEEKNVEGRSNKIDYMEAYDDRVEQLFPDGIDHRCRIGDVMLTIPPLAIDMNRVSNTTKVKTLRSKSSMMIKGGSSVTTLTLQLYFHDVININGRATKMHKDSDRYYYMDGLRPLIAQFKKAPFVPIDNKYINETLGIDNVALVNLNVQTIPGFPQSIAASLTLAKFEHETFTPQFSRMAEAMNYPMFRWYYQEPLRTDVAENERSPYRTWLKPVPNDGMSNDFRFKMVSEDSLLERKQAIRELRYMVNPMIMEERFMDPTTGFTSGGDGSDEYTMLGKKYKDGLAAQRVLDMYKKYIQMKLDGKISKKRNSDGSMAEDEYMGVTVETPRSGSGGINDMMPSKLPTLSNQGKSTWKELYGDATEAEVLKKSHYAPFESSIHHLEAKWGEEQGGAIRLRLYSEENMALIGEEFKKTTNGELVVYVFHGKDTHILDRIIARGKDAEDAYLNGIDEWNKTKAAVEATEGQLPMEEFGISGELTPTSVSILYENQFSSAQLQAVDGPTFQFLGGQDPYIQVSFEADEFAVADIRYMMEETERYAKEYRTGITSGFLGVENDLMGLFGVTTVMPETVQVRTVPGFPGRYQVQMTLAGFDKTQKRTEQLEGISPIYGDKIDRESRKAGTQSETADQAIIQMQMKNMELYPDLELPTFNELISALPYMNAKCDAYLNETGGIYVDPDFYMATPVTTRELIRDQSTQGQELALSDFSGISMMTGSQYTEPLEGEPGMWDLLNSLDGKVSQVDPNFSWGGEVTGGGQTSDGEGEAGVVTFESSEVEKYVTNRDKLREVPTYKQWIKFGYGDNPQAYDLWKEKKLNPEEWEIYNEIYKWVDKLWVEESFVYNDKGVSWKDKAWTKIAYSSIEDMHDLNFNHLRKKPEYLKDGKKERKLDKVSMKDYKATKNKIPRERIANYIKALFQARSRWRQVHSSNIPILDGKGNAAGIGGVPISSEAKDIDTARRLLWDWKYNVEIAIKQLFKGYKAAAEHKKLKYRYRPWEWMIVAYSTGSIDSPIENPLLNEVHMIFRNTYNKVEKMYATPTSDMSVAILQQRNGYSSREMGVIKGEKGPIIDTLLDMGYRSKKKDKKTDHSKDETRKILEKKTDEEIRKLYDKWTKENYGKETLDSVSRGNQLIDQKDLQRSLNRVDNKEVTELTDYLEDGKTYIDNAEGNRLVNQSTPQDIFPGMFKDMINHDHRMRLLRAFPTFQMFIVDEGRWMTNYRLWDNLYGFNAIQSIDVHRSRKIAADTAVITMTNIYSNLTSRTLDTTYEEWDYKFWDNLVFGNPNEKILEARKELLNSLLLQTGARIHLRLGYGSSAVDLPVVFNGTITEMSAEDVVTIVCQGDGVELGNVISGDPGDTNKKFMKITEPRDLICKLMTSKGSWFKDTINYVSNGSLYRDNPLGIQHFGQPAGERIPKGLWKPFNEDYGEAAQNIYSSNGMNTYSQWTMADGTSIPWSFKTPVMRWAQPGDEDNIILPLYNNTVWDVTQTIAYCSPDYIAAVHPFEMRSTLFFGKPYWSMAYTYDSRYEYNQKDKTWSRLRDVEHRKPYAQFHMLDSTMDIISNKIKASEEGVYTNVIVNYDGKQTPVLYADWDIRFDKQKTTVIDAQIVARMNGMDKFTSEKQAFFYGVSAVRDYMKDMYKGELLVLGDPTIKPHDICCMQDTMLDMSGNFMVKAVTHHFSQETGFVTSIQPDVLAVSDDLAMLSVANWGYAALVKFSATVAGYKVGAKALKKLVPSHVSSAILKYGGQGALKVSEVAMEVVAKSLPKGDPHVERYQKTLSELRKMKLDDPARPDKLKILDKHAERLASKVDEWDREGKFLNEKGKKVKGMAGKRRMQHTIKLLRSGTTALKDGKKAFTTIRSIGIGIMATNPLSLLAAAITTWAIEGIAETYRRNKAAMQVVLIMPLMYQGRQYTAGINGHKGMVIGDPMGKLDSFLSGTGMDGKDDGGIMDNVMKFANWLFDADDKQYSVTQEDLQNGFKDN